MLLLCYIYVTFRNLFRVSDVFLLCMQQVLRTMDGNYRLFRVSDVVLCMQQVLRTMDGNYQHSMHSLPFLVLVLVVVHNTDLCITVMLYYMYSTSAVSLGVCRTCWLKCLHMTKKIHTHMACWHFSIISIHTPLVHNAIPCTLHRYTYCSGHDTKVMPWTTTHRKLTLTTQRPRDYIACLTVSKDSFPARQTTCMYVWIREYIEDADCTSEPVFFDLSAGVPASQNDKQLANGETGLFVIHESYL